MPQGRCAETLLFSTLSTIIAEDSKSTVPPVIISNGFFDTTGANASAGRFELHTFTQPAWKDPFPREIFGKVNDFKGGLDLAGTEAFLDENPGQTSMILITITNNYAAAQPVSMANIRETSALAKRKNIPFLFDACQFAENAMFIHDYEDGYADKSIPEIDQEILSYIKGFTIFTEEGWPFKYGRCLLLPRQRNVCSEI